MSCTESAGVPAPDTAGGFLIKPYIQNPATDAMTVIWFSKHPQPGEVHLSWTGDNGLRQQRIFNSVPVVADALGYHPAEISRLTDSAVLSLPFHHEVRLEGLGAGTSYDYLVEQGDHKAGGRFRTYGEGDEAIRFIVYADSETEPESTGKPASWPGIDPATQDRLYPVDQTTGYRENLKVIMDRNPDFIAIAGDLVQSGGEQRDWDEFWRHNMSLAASIPIFPALGNHEYFGGPQDMGKYGTSDSERAVNKYTTYFDLPTNGAHNSAHHERYYSTRYGPVSLVVLDLNSSAPHRGDMDPNWRLKGENEGGIAPDWQPGSEQHRWLEQTLIESQKTSPFTFVLFHNCPYSSGIHGLPPGEGAGKDILSGLPLQSLTPLFLKYGVDVLLTGHDEMYEHSIVNGREILINGETTQHQLHVFDVGIGGDGLRGPIEGLTNSHQSFLAHSDAPEIYAEDGRLIGGGKHYGHLEVNVYKDRAGQWQARLDMVYVFPVTGINGEIMRFERRLYDDTTLLKQR